MASCPTCEAEVTLPEDAVVNELLDCRECATELEIVSLQPAVLREAPLEAEDWGE